MKTLDISHNIPKDAIATGTSHQPTAMSTPSLDYSINHQLRKWDCQSSNVPLIEICVQTVAECP